MDVVQMWLEGGYNNNEYNITTANQQQTVHLARYARFLMADSAGLRRFLSTAPDRAEPKTLIC